MENNQRKRQYILLLAGILGCILMGTSDWLMIYGDTAYEGSLQWLTLGAANVSAGRNALALGLAFPAVILYSIALLAMGNYIPGDRQKKTWNTLTLWGMTPWLCLHLFYVMILFGFAWLTGQGQGALALRTGEAMFAQFSWVVLLAEALILLPFLYMILLMVRKKTLFSRWMALNNPLLIYVVLKAVTLVLPDVPARLAFVNGLMSESMVIWFAILMAFTGKLSSRKM